LDLHISLGGRGDQADRIYRQVRDAILDGRLRAGERVPPSRELARQLAVSRNTVAAAYDRLVGDGFLQGRAGAGTFVAMPRAAGSRRAPVGALQPSPRWAGVAEDLGRRPAVEAARYDQRAGHPDGSLFPLATWRRLLARSLRAGAEYADPAGLAALRAAVARAVGLSRSVRASAEDVIVTNGAQQGLDLIGRVLIEPGSVVAVEEPGYPPARLALTALGARVVPVPVDGEGLVTEALPRSARLVYVTPSHQYPLGVAMSLPRRAALLEWAQRHGAAIVEDDYDSEFRYSDRPLEPLQSLDRAGRVVYVGSFAKTLLPALRLGFLVAPASLRPALVAAKRLTDWHAEPAAQAALAGFIDEGLLRRHVRTVTRVYATRHDLVTSAARGVLADRFTLVPSSAGLHVTLLAAPDVDVPRVVARLRDAGVAVEPLAGFYAGAAPADGLVVGYGMITAADLPVALDLLDRASRPTG
jgi:GntR family transcriptional regulator/MocR family aminotransferase